MGHGIRDRPAVDEDVCKVDVREELELPSPMPPYPAHDLFGLLSELVPVSEVVERTQALAALFHPDTPNDVAPREFNLQPQSGLPESPLEIKPRATGFLAL